jgi:hypothetical protein
MLSFFQTCELARSVAKSLIAAFGSREMGGGEDTSRSARRLPPPGPLLFFSTWQQPRAFPF